MYVLIPRSRMGCMTLLDKYLVLSGVGFLPTTLPESTTPTPSARPLTVSQPKSLKFLPPSLLHSVSLPQFPDLESLASIAPGAPTLDIHSGHRAPEADLQVS